jgi:hypothetical protein
VSGKLLRLFTEDLETALKKMGYESSGILFTALVCKNNGHEIPEIPERIAFVWDIILAQISRSDEYLQTKREAGKAGGLAKSSSAKQTLASLAKSTSYPIPSYPILSEKKKKNTSVPDPDFDQFWEAYPKKNGRQDALKAWTKTAKDRPALQELLGIIELLKTKEAWTKDGGKYVKEPAAWLNGHRWEDEIPKCLAALDPLRPSGIQAGRR